MNSNVTARAEFEASRRAKISETSWYDRLVLARAAEHTQADILATNRRGTLLTPVPPRTRPTFCLSSAETIAACSLVLRHHEAWLPVWPERIEYLHAEWLARRLIILDKVFDRNHSLMRFRSIGALTAAPQIAELAESMVQRLSTAIAIRDVVAIEAMKPVNNDGMDKLSAHIEWLCLTVSGTFDALAIILNSLLPSPVPRKATSWTEKDWRREASSVFPEYFEVTKEANVVGILNLCKRLRDTIHSVAPGATFYRGPEIDGDATYITVPREKVDGFCASCTSAGGRYQDWGVIKIGDEILLDPMTFTGRLLDKALSSLRLAVTGFPWAIFRNLALPPAESPQVSALYREGIEFMYVSYGLSR
ncbi:hypothetical protein ACTXG6_20045 [Pseudonocardia sp. Cha107L01]|uniref:hypothetical protein n=1 Tax=Pseudonocardia sp. Cha107L01 TaxID=3457576 RepID=UPI00403EF4A4